MLYSSVVSRLKMSIDNLAYSDSFVDSVLEGWKERCLFLWGRSTFAITSRPLMSVDLLSDRHKGKRGVFEGYRWFPFFALDLTQQGTVAEGSLVNWNLWWLGMLLCPDFRAARPEECNVSITVDRSPFSHVLGDPGDLIDTHVCARWSIRASVTFQCIKEGKENARGLIQWGFK